MRLAALVLAGCALSGCLEPSSEKRVGKAMAALEREDFSSAGIEVRNLLKSKPESAPLRFLLGRALFGAGDLAGASIELERAQRLGHPDVEVLPVLVEVRLAQRRYRDVVDLYAMAQLPDPAANARLQVLVAQAWRGLDRLDEADRAVAAALQAMPGLPEALVMQVQLQSDRGQTDAALEAARRLVERTPDQPGAWVLQGNLLIGRDAAGAVAAFRQAVKLRPRLGEAHFGLARALINQPDLAAAAEQVATMRRVLPPLPSVGYMDALVTFLKGDHARAAEIADETIKRAEDDPALLLLAGAAQAKVGDAARAEALLAKAITLAPGWVRPRVELAALQVGTAPKRALETLDPLLSSQVDDAAVWGLAGQAHTGLGDFRAADAAFARAKALQPDAPGLRVQAARLSIARGEVESGIRELAAISASDRDGAPTDPMLVAAHMKRGDAASALRVIDGAIAKRPNDAALHVLRGRILAERGDRAGARAAFERALGLDPALRVAVDLLAAQDIQALDFAAARQRYEAYLKVRPKSGVAITALAEIALRSGSPADEIRALLDRAVQTDPVDPLNWLAAIDLQQRLGDPAATLSRAQAANAAIPNQPDILLVLARAQLAMGQANQAVATLTPLTKLRPDSAAGHLLLATAYGLNNNPTAAKAPMARALALEPDDLAVLRGAIALARAEGQPGAGLEIARAVQARRPTASLGWQLEAEVLEASGQREAALAAWQAAFARTDATPYIAAATHRALVSGRPDSGAAARQFEARYLASKPRDGFFLTYLAEAAQAAGDAASAERYLRRALAIQTDDPLLMNNLAALLVETRPKEALEIAERAVRLAPSHPALLSTLASAQMRAGDFLPALRNQRRAIEFAPAEPVLRLHLARIYVAKGDKTKARDELRPLTGSTVPAALRSEAETMLRGLDS
jgi:putative PEP-CTERM system TPR-repeat lipoprotein